MALTVPALMQLVLLLLLLSDGRSASSGSSYLDEDIVVGSALRDAAGWISHKKERNGSSGSRSLWGEGGWKEEILGLAKRAKQRTWRVWPRTSKREASSESIRSVTDWMRLASLKAWFVRARMADERKATARTKARRRAIWPWIAGSQHGGECVVLPPPPPSSDLTR